MAVPILGSPLQSLQSIPLATRAFVGVLWACSAFYYFLQRSNTTLTYTPYLVLVPGLSPWYPWTIITAAFIETNIIEMLISTLALALSLRYLERLWGAVETIKFVLITVGVSNFIAIIVNCIEFILLRSEFFLYSMTYRGQMALQVGILVALTQAIPEHKIILFGAFGIRIKRLPMLYVTFSNVMCILGLQSPYILIQFGWLVSWFYLRFYKRTGSADSVGGETWGDRSETFAFVHWFPPFLNKPVTILSNVAYDISVRLRLVKAYPLSSSPDLESGAGSYASLPGGARAEAERRRAMALKALDQRLASAKTARPTSEPSNVPSQAAPASPPPAKGTEDEGKGKAREDDA